jgi:serine/threonine-protein kinase
MASAVDADALKPGTLCGAYVLKKELASGGGGDGLRGAASHPGPQGAVKVLRRQLAASPQMVARFVQEARAVNMIKHPSIVDIFEFDELPDGRPFYVMELLEGIDLRSILNERGRFPPGEVLEILEPVCSALQAAHDLGIVHRDLKASNIFIATRRQARRQAARLRHREAHAPGRGRGRLTVVGTRLGTSYTMAPEQIRGDGVDARTDIYALGVVLYHLLTGQYPFRAETMTDIERQHLEAPPPRPSQARRSRRRIDASCCAAWRRPPTAASERQGVHRGAARGRGHEGGGPR